MKFSLCNYNWKLDEHDVVNTRRLELKHNISPLLARCMMPIMNKLHQEVLRDSNQKNLAQHNPPQDIFQSLKSTKLQLRLQLSFNMTIVSSKRHEAAMDAEPILLTY